MSQNTVTPQIDKEKLIEHLLNVLNKTQEISNSIDNRCFGTVSITVVLAIVVMLISDISGIIEYKDIFIFFTPLAITISLSVYAYNYKMAAIVRGHLAGIEKMLNKELGKQIYVYNLGFQKLYKSPHFITNDVMGIMFFIICTCLIIVCFVYIFSNINLNYLWYKIVKYIYLFLSIAFDGIYIHDLANTNVTKEAAKEEFIRLYNTQT